MENHVNSWLIQNGSTFKTPSSDTTVFLILSRLQSSKPYVHSRVYEGKHILILIIFNRNPSSNKTAFNHIGSKKIVQINTVLIKYR